VDATLNFLFFKFSSFWLNKYALNIYLLLKKERDNFPGKIILARNPSHSRFIFYKKSVKKSLSFAVSCK
jgi:hypothetical protein